MNLFERLFGRRPPTQETASSEPVQPEVLENKSPRKAKYQPDGWPNPAVFLADVPVGRLAAIYLRTKSFDVNTLQGIVVAVEETPQKGNERVSVQLEDNGTVLLAGGTTTFRLPWPPGPEFSKASSQ